MNNVRTDSLIIKDVRKTAREPAGSKVMSTPVRPDGFTLLLTGVLMILLTVNAAPHPPLPVVRPITALTVPAPHPALTPAVIPVINAAMIPVQAELLKTTPAPMFPRQNAVLDVIVVKTVLQAAPLIPALMSGLPNAEAVMLVPTPAGQAQNPFPVLLLRTKSGFLPPNAVQAAIPANITLIVP